MKFPTKIPNRKTKTKTGKGGITPTSLNESIEILKLDSSLVEGKGNISSPQFQAFTLQKAAAGTLALLLRGKTPTTTITLYPNIFTDLFIHVM